MPTDDSLRRSAAGRPPPVSLLSLATAVPPHRLSQSDITAAAATAFGDRTRLFDRLAPVFETAGVRRRFAARPIPWYLEPQGWPERSAVFVEVVGALFVEAAETALRDAGVTAAEVDTVVFLSATGIATPSLEARVAGRMGFRTDVRRVPVFGLGCAGGVTGLAVAARLAAAEPGSTVLMVAVELCTLAFRLDRLGKADIVSAALFGDGAAACVLRAGGDGPAAIEAAAEHMWPDTLDVMGWSIDPVGLGVILSPDVPAFAAERLGPAVAAMLRHMGLEAGDIDRFVCHPGSSKVITAIERALDLGQGRLDHEREVLADYGNMSAPTVLFILQRVIAAGMPARALLLAMGPGFTATGVSLRRAA